MAEHREPLARIELLQGTLDLIVLQCLRWGPCHGYAVSRWIKRTTDEVLTVEEGALYPALHRMEQRGWLTADWAVSDRGRRAKYYSVTADGERALGRESSSWNQYVTAVARVVGEGSP